jgi:hypothetical protein
MYILQIKIRLAQLAFSTDSFQNVAPAIEKIFFVKTCEFIDVTNTLLH